MSIFNRYYVRFAQVDDNGNPIRYFIDGITVRDDGNLMTQINIILKKHDDWVVIDIERADIKQKWTFRTFREHIKELQQKYEQDYKDYCTWLNNR